MNTPRNYITALPAYDFTTDSLDDLLPFVRKYVFVQDVERAPKGYDKWRLIVRLKINDQNVTLTTTTTDLSLLNDWYSADGQINQQTLLRVVEIVLAANEDRLEEFN